MVGTHGVWVAVGIAMALLIPAAMLGGSAIVQQRRTSRAARGGTPLVVGGMLRATTVLAVFGWVVLVSALVSGYAPVTADTLAGTAIPAPPELVQAGIPATFPTSDVPPMPDPIAQLKVGDCVEVPMEPSTDKSGAPTWQPGAPAPADCTTLDANYRVVQTDPGPCTDPLYRLETSHHDRAGKLAYHLCLAFDWRTGVCYDTTHLDEPSKVDCGTRGDHIVQATAVLENTTDGNGCPRDGRGAVWVVWDKMRLTVCFRGADTPGR
ncbi:hypothetical protein ACIP5Y_02450 [Nocardia sp. NPDC088792]|uniref:hypothetical protein n=1 Tax=Nocardia sp. NPDC088792 TaxID=3364332 RepID=UPI003807EAF0